MEDGQAGSSSEKKVGLILQARMGSKRLLNKAMLPLGDQPMLEFIIKRIMPSGYKVIIATTDREADDQIADLAVKLNVGCFRGSEANVLDRFYQAAKAFNLDVIVRLTGDNPFVDAEFIKDNLNRYLASHSDRSYMATQYGGNYPLGISMEVFSFLLLEEAWKNSVEEAEKEHVTPYIYTKASIQKMAIDYKDPRHHYRLTVDTPEDYELAKTLVDKFDCEKKTVEQIIEIIDDNPGLLQINQTVSQKKWHEI